MRKWTFWKACLRCGRQHNSQRFLVHRVMYLGGDFYESTYGHLKFFKESGTFRADGNKYRQLKPVGWE